jgi:hypothetical protein
VRSLSFFFLFRTILRVISSIQSRDIYVVSFLFMRVISISVSIVIISDNEEMRYINNWIRWWIKRTSRNNSVWFDFESIFVTSNSIRLRFDFLPNRIDSIWVFADLKSQNKELHLEIRSLYICLYACLVRSMRARWKKIFFCENYRARS